MLGEGEAGPAGSARGDLYVALDVKPHDRFERDGYDLHCTHEVSIVQATLGDEVNVETPWGPHKLKIPSGTQPGHRFRIHSQGVPRSDHENGSRGDLYVHTDLKIPKKLTQRQRELLVEFAREAGEEPVHEDKGFLERVKESIDHITGKKDD